MSWYTLDLGISLNLSSHFVTSGVEGGFDEWGVRWWDRCLMLYCMLWVWWCCVMCVMCVTLGDTWWYYGGSRVEWWTDSVWMDVRHDVCVFVGVRVVCELYWGEVVMNHVGCSTCGRASNSLRGIFGNDGIFDITTPPPSRRGRRTRRTDKNGEYSVTSRGILIHDREVVV